MRFLKKLYTGLRASLSKKSIEHIINNYDRDVNVDCLRDGFLFASNIVDTTYVPNLSHQDCFGMATSRNVDGQMAIAISKAVSHFKSRIVDYLGTEVRIDDICLYEYTPSRAVRKSISGSWHDDNCGHRIKMYICLIGDGNTPTVIIPGSHKRRYKFRFNDFFRFIGYSDIKHYAHQVHLRYKGGDVAIFDTNAMHRGLYEEPSSPRTVIVVEFINKYKSDKISGIAPCGPGAAPSGEALLSVAAFIELISTGLIDERLIKLDGDLYSYSISNKLEN